MSGDNLHDRQPHIYYTEFGKRTLEEHHLSQIDMLKEEIQELKNIVNYLESKVKTHHTIFTNYELSFIKRRTSR